MKTLLTAVALTTLISSPAFALARERQAPSPSTTQTGPGNGRNAVRDAEVVMCGVRMMGRDPDPWIRNELLRHANSSYPD